MFRVQDSGFSVHSGFGLLGVRADGFMGFGALLGPL